MAKGTRWDMLVSLKTKGEAGLKRMGNSMQGLQGRLKNVRMAALSVNTAFKAMAVILTAGAFTRFVTGAINQADAFGKLSRQTGVAADTLQSYVNAGKLAGVEQVAIDKGLSRLAQSMREADQGVATYTDAFDALGIKVRDAQGNFKTSEQVFGEIADRFADMPNGATKAALAMELFSRQGRKLIPLLNGGSEAMKMWNYETSEGFAANAEYFNDQLLMLSFGFDGFRKQLTDALLPALNSIAEAFSSVLSSDNDWSNFFGFIEGAIRGFAVTVFGVMKLFQEVAILGETIIGNVKGMMQAVENATPEWVKKLVGGGVGMAKELGGRFVTQQKKNLRGVLGDEYVDDAKARFQSNLPVLQKITTGKSEAGAEYGFNKGGNEAADLPIQLERTFGGTMQVKLEAFKNSLMDLGTKVSGVVIKAFKKMEDSLVEFAMTGKLKFKDLANSIIKDLIRIAIQQAITGPLAGGFGSLFGGKLPGRASGGPVTGGRPYIVGERGSELFVPKMSGQIIPNNQLGGGNTVVNVSVDAKGTQSQGDEPSAQQLGRLIGAAVNAELIKQRRPGGLLAPA